MIRAQILKHLLGAREGERGGSKGYVRGEATARVMEKNRYVKITEREEVRRDDPTEYFSPCGSEVPFESQRR